MAYIGRQLARGENKLFDDISSSFNGSTTTFNLTVSSVATATATPYQLFVSLGGVMQKPNTDFTTAGNQITFTTAPAAGLSCWIMMQGDTIDQAAIPDSSVTPSKISGTNFAFSGDLRLKDADGSHYVGFASPTTVSTNKVWTLPAADGTASQYLQTNGSGVLTWSTVSIGGATGIDFNDNVKARFGTGNDLEIFHDSSNSYIKDTGTGNLFIDASITYLRNAAGDEHLANFNSDGAVNLYHNGVLKFATSSTGVAVTGSATISTNLTVTGDLTVSGTTTTINTQTLDVEDKNVVIGKVSSPSDTTADGGGWTLKGATDKTFNWVNSTDAWTSSEHIHLGDDKKLLTGTGSDLEIYHSSSNAASYIQNSTGNLHIEAPAGSSIKLRKKGTSEVLLDAISDGAVELYHDNSKKLETTTGGINVTGAIQVNGAALSSAPTITATASGGISANKPVIVNSSGQAVEIGVQASAVGTDALFSNDNSNGTKVVGNGAGQFVVITSDGNPRFQVASISGTTISWGTQVTLNASSGAANDDFDVCYIPQKDCYMIATCTSSQQIKCACFTVSGTSITMGSLSNVLHASSCQYVRIACDTRDSNSDGWCSVFFKTSYGGARPMWSSAKPASTVTNAPTVSGNVPYIAGYTQIQIWDSCFNEDQGCFYGLFHTEYGLTGIQWTLSSSNGSTSRSGTLDDVTADSGYQSNGQATVIYDASIKKVVCGYRKSNSLTARIINYQNNNWDALNTYSEHTVQSGAQPTKIQGTYFAKTGEVMFVWQHSNNSGKIKPVKVSSTFSYSNGSLVEFDSAGHDPHPAPDADGVLLSFTHTSRARARYFVPAATNMTSENFVGFAADAISNGASGTINIVGNQTTQSSLTPGQKYYIQENGSLALTAATPSVVAGTAISSTKLIINPAR